MGGCLLNEVEAAKIGEGNDKQVDRRWEIRKSQALSKAQKR